MNRPNHILLILEYFNAGGEIAYFSKYEPQDPTEIHWTNNGAGVNEDTLVCMADAFTSMKFNNPQKLSEQEMDRIKWAKWKDLCDLINPVLISQSNVNALSDNFQTVNTFHYYDGSMVSQATYENDLFEISAISQKIEDCDNEYEAVIFAPKGKVIVPIKRNYSRISFSLRVLLSDKIQKMNIKF
jgi:hypothetical protein